MLKFLFLYNFLFNFVLVNSNYDEFNLRRNLLLNYNKDVRPVKQYDDIIDINMGLGVQNIESFNQMEETIDINLWLRMNWIDEYLKWDSSISNLTFLSMNKNQIWVPDIELLNAASLPEIYTLKGGMNLYNNGEIMWSNPAIFKFSCKLKLKYFPFDTQRCSMKFSSWIYNNNLLNLQPYSSKEKQIDILHTFSHSEWKIKDVSLITYDEERLCCKDITFSNIDYIIELERYPHYYNISMGMTISLVIVNFIIILIKPNNISRTSTAVFIPLTILALQLTLANKIPVVGYYTLMDYFFLCCFITSMICSIESGLIYSLLTSKSKFIYKLFKNCFDIPKLIKKDSELKEKIKRRLDKHNLQIADCSNDIDCYNNENNNNEFGEVINELKTKTMETEFNRTDSYKESLNNIKTEILDNDSNKTEDDLENNMEINNIIKTIDYDDITLSLSYKEILVFNEIEHYVRKIDNICRCLIPLVFIILISVIFSYQN